MASKTRNLARDIAHARMAEEGINCPNSRNKTENKNSFFSANWRKYVFPPSKSRKFRKKKNKKI